MKIVGEGDVRRFNYAWGVLQGVNSSQGSWSKSRISYWVRVAGGNGLVELERIAEKVESILGIELMFMVSTLNWSPKPQDYRDLPNLWSEGYFPMDKENYKSG